MSLSRRQFIHGTLGAAVLSACGSESGGRNSGDITASPSPSPTPMPTPTPVPECDDPFAGGRLREVLRFEGGSPRFHTKLSRGWDGRLYTDLSVLGPDRLAVSNEDFYLRTFYPDFTPPEPWTLTIGGLVEEEVVLSFSELEPLIEPMGMHVLECSGNDVAQFGLLSACEWSGVPVAAVLDRVRPLSSATAVLVDGFDDHDAPSTHSTPGASWIFTFEQLAERGAFFGTHMNGEPLTLDHGFPMRLYVPGWFGCTCIKWARTMELVDDSAPATTQMHEFAGRTHQTRRWELASDYLPAFIDQSAMPVRIERWEVDGAPLYRVIGILWGGDELTDQLALRFGDQGRLEPVTVCPPMSTNQSWTLWTYAWEPPRPDSYNIRCAILDPDIRTRRLDTGFYERTIVIA